MCEKKIHKIKSVNVFWFRVLCSPWKYLDTIGCILMVVSLSNVILNIPLVHGRNKQLDLFLVVGIAPSQRISLFMVS